MFDRLTLMILGFTADASASQAATQASTSPASQPARTASDFMKILGPTFSDTTLTGWVTLLLGIAIGLAASRIVQTGLRSLAARMEKRQWHARAAILQYAAGPAGLAVFSAGLGIGLQGLYFGPQSNLGDRAVKIIGLLYILAIAWLLFNLVDLLDLALRKLTAKKGTPHLDETLLTILRKTLRVFLLVLFALFIAQNTFGANITTWLAGLGIAGLAVSLAAQDSVKNLFGSVSVLMDRPFSIGDRIVFGSFDGTVETIGFRSTKIRTISGTLVTVPNMKFTDGTVENISARPFLNRSFSITLVCETPPEKIEQAVRIISEILHDPATAKSFDLNERPPRVYFNQINADSLNISVNYWFAMTDDRDLWNFQSHAQEINLRILRDLKSADIEMSYPTHALALTGGLARQATVRIGA